MDFNVLPLDVYCGKDRTLENNEGNKIYKQLIAENVSLYRGTTVKTEKMKITADILKEFKCRSNGGAFKRFQNNEWIAYPDDNVVRDKISHALRSARVQGPRLPRRNSMSINNEGSAMEINDSSSQPLRKRPRSDSVASCPAAIETASMHPLLLNELPQDLNDINISISTDALLMWERMIHPEKWDKFDEISWHRQENPHDTATALTTGGGSEQISLEIPEVLDNTYEGDSLSICSWDCILQNDGI